MHLRPFVPMGLALVITGCHSYFPNSYGYNGPYSSIPAGTYAPGATYPAGGRAPPTSTQGQIPTPVGGQMNAGSGQSGGASSKNSKSVPDYRGPSDVPPDLGTPASDDDRNAIKRGRNSGGNPGKSVDEVSDEPDEPLTSLDNQEFVSPALYRTAAASSGDGEPRRLTAKPRSSPYKKDPDGYRWLRGTVARDPKTKAWRITYSNDPNDRDPYGGNLALVDDECLDTLIDKDVILVSGTIDESAPDRFGKPSYRIQSMDRLKLKED